MKITVKRRSIVKYMLLICLLVISTSRVLSSESVATEYTPFELQGNFSNLNEISNENSYYPGLAYTPFKSENYQPGLLGPVLYGPGGDPIGGIPSGEGTWILFSAVVGYCILKIIKKRKSVLN